MISVSAASGLVVSEQFRYTVSRDHPKKSAAVATSHRKQTRCDLLRDSHSSLRRFRRYQVRHDPYSISHVAIFRQNRGDPWYGCCTLTTASQVKGMAGHVGRPPLYNMLMLMREFAAHPRVGRYAMQPIACFREGRGFPGDTTYKC